MRSAEPQVLPERLPLPLPLAALGGHRSGFTVVRLLLGALLMTAAGLKFFDRSPESIDRLGLFLSPHAHIAAIEAEALLGLWLLTGAMARLLWLAALLGFALLASVSLYLGIEGQPSCGCFGASLAVSPWYVFALDLAAISMLLLWRPRQEEPMGLQYLAILRRGVVVAAGSALILVAIFGVLTWWYGSLHEARLHLREEWIVVEQAVIEVGEGVLGEERVFTLRLTNHTGHPVHVLGGTTSCQCIAAEEAPIALPPGGSQSIRVRMTFRGAPGHFGHRFVLYTDCESQATVTARFVGRVTARSAPPS